MILVFYLYKGSTFPLFLSLSAFSPDPDAPLESTLNLENMHFLLTLLAFSSISQAGPESSLAAKLRRDVEVNPLNDGVTYLDGVLIADIPQRLSTPEIVSTAISRVGWDVTCDSSQEDYECNKTIDGNADTFWLSENNTVNAPFSHWIMIDMQTSYPVGNVSIEPRQDGSADGRIGLHTIALR